MWRRQAPPSGASQLVVPGRESQDMIRRFHDSLFAGHLGVSRTVYHLLDWVYWPGLRQDVRSHLASCVACLARKSPCPRRAPMGHVDGIGWPWICWTCLLQPRKVMWTVFLDGRRLARCLIRWHWQWLMLSFNILYAN